jgi:hypothetical protein
MPLIDVDALRERFDIDPEIKDTRLTPHIGAASRRLRQWVGETTYALTDAETVEDLKNAEANLAFHFAILGLNSPMSTRGIVVQAQASEGKEIRKYLAPKESRSAATGSAEGTVYGADGKEKKKVTLRPRPAFNYAAAVAEGRPAIAPRQAKALLIPVPTAPTTGGYLLAGGQIYVVRRSARATQPNPYDERAAKRLENEAPAIAESVLAKFV